MCLIPVWKAFYNYPRYNSEIISWGYEFVFDNYLVSCDVNHYLPYL